MSTTPTHEFLRDAVYAPLPPSEARTRCAVCPEGGAELLQVFADEWVCTKPECQRRWLYQHTEPETAFSWLMQVASDRTVSEFFRHVTNNGVDR
jgi:hypothetical protein